MFAQLADSGAEVLLSAASAWEIAIKNALGRLPLPQPPSEYVPARMRRDAVDGLPVTLAHALHVGTLPRHHADPCCRLLVAQAQLERLILVTAASKIHLYDVETLDATLVNPW